MSITIPPPAFTGSATARETVGLASSGTSPGRIHLLGLGAVGRAFLDSLAGRGATIVAASDSTATVYARDGLAPLDLVRIKADGRRLIDVEGSEDLPTEFAVDVIESDVLVDAVVRDQRDPRLAVECARFALRRGSRVVFASRRALAANAHAWRAEIASGRIGWNAALGGTGRLLAAELPDLARRCEEITLVTSAASTAVIGALERGLAFDEAVAQARVSRLLDLDRTADFDGTHVAEQLAITAGAIFGHALDLERIERDDLRAIDVDLVRDRARRGFTTRFVGCARRDGRPTVRLEEVPRGSILAAPPDRVVCAYRIDPRNLRVHVGRALRPEGAALALLEDLFAPIGGAA
jgi:homoserine dehydrogenase